MVVVHLIVVVVWLCETKSLIGAYDSQVAVLHIILYIYTQTIVRCLFSTVPHLCYIRDSQVGSGSVPAHLTMHAVSVE